MPDEIKCARCGQKRLPLGYAPLPTELGQKIASEVCQPCRAEASTAWYVPLPTELGQKIATEVCQPCWAEWLQAQTRIINHYGLDLTNPDAQGFLMDNMKGFFYGSADLAQIDTSKEGSIKW